MQVVKNIIKQLLQLNPHSKLSPFKNIIHVGSKTHGYYLPENFITGSSVCYLVGAGEDISFDTELVVNYGCKVFILDPAPEGINHFNLLKSKVENGEKIFVGHKDTPFYYRINKEQLKTITYLEKGVWDADTIIKFYEPTLDNYASHSIELFQESGRFIEVPVDRLSNIMKSFGHTSIDLLKLEIEGAEYKVIETIIEDKLDIKAILVEYDEVFHSKGFPYLFRIKKSKDLLLNNGYKLVHTTDLFKCLFVKKEVYNKFKK